MEIDNTLKTSRAIALIGVAITVVIFALAVYLKSPWVVILCFTGVFIVLWARYGMEAIRCQSGGRRFGSSIWYGRRTGGIVSAFNSSFQYCPGCGTNLDKT